MKLKPETKKTLEQIAWTGIPSAIVVVGKLLLQSMTNDPATAQSIDLYGTAIATALPIGIAHFKIKNPIIKYLVQGTAAAFGGYHLLENFQHNMSIYNQAQELEQYRYGEILKNPNKANGIRALIGLTTAGISRYHDFSRKQK